MLTKFLISESVFCNLFEFRNQSFFPVPTDTSDNIPLDLNMTVKKTQPTQQLFSGKALFLKLFCSKFLSGTGLTYREMGYRICAVLCPCRWGATALHTKSNAPLRAQAPRA